MHNCGALLLLTDDLRLPDPLPAARALPRGAVIILRSRDGARRALLAASLRGIAKARGLLLLIADDPRLAARIGADGIHLPQARAKEAAHWRAHYPHWFVTAAAHSLGAVLNAGGADVVLLSPVFGTASHPDAPALTPARARLIARQVPMPIFALGGISAQNAGQLQGFAGLAAIGALS